MKRCLYCAEEIQDNKLQCNKCQKFILTQEQEDFIQFHKIDYNEIFDATWIRQKDYKIIMKQYNKKFAIWVTPCKNWHTFRTRHWQCIQCDTSKIAYLKRSDKLAYVYVAKSKKQEILKIWYSEDVDDRLNHLNKDSYAWINDWIILYKCKYNNALKVENFLHTQLSKYHSKINYNHYWRDIWCYETFYCSFAKIKEIIDNYNIANNIKDYFLLNNVDIYEFSDKKIINELFAKKYNNIIRSEILQIIKDIFPFWENEDKVMLFFKEAYFQNIDNEENSIKYNRSYYLRLWIKLELLNTETWEIKEQDLYLCSFLALNSNNCFIVDWIEINNIEEKFLEKTILNFKQGLLEVKNNYYFRLNDENFLSFDPVNFIDQDIIDKKLSELYKSNKYYEISR